MRGDFERLIDQFGPQDDDAADDIEWGTPKHRYVEGRDCLQCWHDAQYASWDKEPEPMVHLATAVRTFRMSTRPNAKPVDHAYCDRHRRARQADDASIASKFRIISWRWL